MTASTLPPKLVAGDTWAFTLSSDTYPAPAWDASIYFENADKAYSATAVDSGSSHAFKIAAATTDTFVPGRFKWFIRVTDGTQVFTAEQGWLEVQPNPASSSSRDHRTDARKMLDALNEFLIGNATTAQQAMQLNGRSISRHSIADLVKWRDQLRNEVKTEEGGTNKGLGRDIKVRMLRG
jgi:hypothetical protein